jgi:hypothetical protein
LLRRLLLATGELADEAADAAEQLLEGVALEEAQELIEPAEEVAALLRLAACIRGSLLLRLLLLLLLLHPEAAPATGHESEFVEVDAGHDPTRFTERASRVSSRGRTADPMREGSYAPIVDRA